MTATERNNALHELDTAQLTALGILMQGGSHQEAADAAGVHRVTVTRWRNHHPAFIARMNEFRSEIAAQIELAAEQHTGAALRVVGQALAESDLTAALRWLGISSRFVGARIGPKDSTEVVECFRRGLPSELDRMISFDQGPSVEDAEAQILRRLGDEHT